MYCAQSTCGKQASWYVFYGPEILVLACDNHMNELLVRDRTVRFKHVLKHMRKRDG